MMTSKGWRTSAALALLFVLCAAPAAAEPGAAASEESQPSRLPDSHWSYGTYYLYPLTRHMEESKIPMACRYALYPVAAILDTVQLPLGAIAGLFGD